MTKRIKTTYTVSHGKDSTSILTKAFHIPRPVRYIFYGLLIIVGLYVAVVVYKNYAEDVKLSEYNQKVKECGKRELTVVVGGIKWGGWYLSPGDKEYKGTPTRSAIHYYCNKQEAAAAGYKPRD